MIDYALARRYWQNIGEEEFSKNEIACAHKTIEHALKIAAQSRSQMRNQTVKSAVDMVKEAANWTVGYLATKNPHTNCDLEDLTGRMQQFVKDFGNGE